VKENLNIVKDTSGVMTYYYLYLIKFEDERFYIGSRKSKVPANEDINYWGSPGKTIRHFWEMEKEKHILFESTDISIQDLRKKEYKMIQKGWEKFGKDKCINKNAGGLNHLDLEVCREAGKKVYEQRKGFFGWTPEKWSKNSKENWHSNKNARGFMSWDEERIKKFREQQRKKFCKTYTFINPSGEKVVINDLPIFCKKNNLSYHSMIEVGNGNTIQHQGWSTVGLEKIKELIEKSWENRYEGKEFYNPKGEKIIINCLTLFAKKNNLNPACLSIVANGGMLQHKGYSILPPEKVKEEKEKLKQNCIKRQAKIVELVNPQGEKVKIYNLVGFCKKNGLNPGNMHNVLTGKKKSCKGWSLNGIEKKEYCFISPQGKIIKTNSLSKFCKEYNLNEKTMSSIHTGRVKRTRDGWTKP
jgi:hypothetical protein